MYILFRHRLLHRLLNAFGMENAPKMYPKTMGSVPFCHHFGDIFRRSAFLCIVAAHWLPFWIPLAPFWFPMAIFRSPFGALWLTFAHLRALFYNFWGLPASSFILYYISNANLIDVQDFRVISHQNTSCS